MDGEDASPVAFSVLGVVLRWEILGELGQGWGRCWGSVADCGGGGDGKGGCKGGEEGEVPNGDGDGIEFVLIERILNGDFHIFMMHASMG